MFEAERMMRRGATLFLLVAFWLPAAWADETLIAHWPLKDDGRDASGNGLHATGANLGFGVAGPSSDVPAAADFNGLNAWLEVSTDDRLRRGQGDFSIAAWVHTEAPATDTPGDILSQYDAVRRRGFHLTLKTNAGVTFSQANERQLQFGIDNNRAEAEWRDEGRPGHALLAFALCVHEGDLYAGTCEPGPTESGRVYRYDGPSQWIDCGAPDRSNSVTAMAVFGGKLYVGTGKYRLAGSALPESENVSLGGRIFQYEGQSRWVDCGELPGVESVGGMVVFGGRLYASSLYRPAAFFRYEGDRRWTACSLPAFPGDRTDNLNGMRVEALGIYNGYLYATSYDGGRVFRYDGQSWTDCGQLGDASSNTQTYAFAVLAGRLHVGTWRSGRVYRFEDVDLWTDVGRLGEELEVMGMLVHNGRLLAGTLPSAEVYEYQGEQQWKRLTQLDATPDVKYRRAWTMAEYQGRVFCSTLPSGQVFSWRCGASTTWDRSFPPGWHHVAAVKRRERLELHVDGQRVARSEPFVAGDYDLTSAAPLRIGSGPHDHFHGRLAEVRLYRRALGPEEIRNLAGTD